LSVKQLVPPPIFKFSKFEVTIMSNELFVELSDEQQEIVAGGASFSLGQYLTQSQFQQVVGSVGGASTAGPGGASSGAVISGGATNTSTSTLLAGLNIIS
jgi:hypothetical protein